MNLGAISARHGMRIDAHGDTCSLGRQSALAEARGLYQMLGHDGNTIETISELISVPPKIEYALRAFARAHPDEAHFVDRVVKFRESVAREFERLVREGVAVAEQPEVEETELNALERLHADAPGVTQGTRKRNSKW